MIEARPAQVRYADNGMRCPSCGTENAPDSRFCGGCGARFAAAKQRLAPTQKISDDASFPQPPSAPPGQGALVYQLADTPQSVPLLPRHAPSGPALAQPGAPQPLRAISSPPPGVYATPPAAPSPPAASVPSGSATPSRLRPRTAQIIDDPSLPLPMVGRRPWGLIIVVLLIDVGLAIAGSWMLHEGLGQRPSAAGAIHQPPPSR